MTAREYYDSILQLLTMSTVVTSQQIEFDEQDIYIAYLKGSVNLVDGSTLFFAQYVQIEGASRGQITRKKFRYHWQARVEKSGTVEIMPGTIPGLPPSQTTCILDLKRRRGRVLQRTCGTS